MKGHRIILGSNSPRRRELLAAMDVAFTVDTDNTFVESYPPDTPAAQVPVFLAEGKSHGFHRPLCDGEILLTADTVVILDDAEVLGKPHSRAEAERMLRALSGCAHDVVTAVTFRSTRHLLTLTDTARVHFAPLTDAEIDYYIEKYRPFDKAGAYGIQEWIGYIGITGITGSFYNVMGFPTHLVYRGLQSFLQTP